MPIRRLAPLAILLLPPALIAQTTGPEGWASHYEQAVKACQARAYPDCLRHLERAERLEPGYPRLIYGLASVYALSGRGADAVTWLERLVAMGLAFNPEQDSDFVSLRDSDGLARVLHGFARNREPVGSSKSAFSLPERDFLAEGLAYDSVTGTFYVGSVHRRKIVAVGPGREVREFVGESSGGLWSVMGLRVDPKQRLLWAASTASPQMIGYRPEDLGRAGLFKFDLASGALLASYLLPGAPEHHWLGDLTVSSTGEVFVTDSRAPVIYRLRPGGDQLQELVRDARFSSLQGAVLSADEGRLLVADYRFGLYAIDLRHPGVVRLTAPGEVTLRGVDGLYRHGQGLIAVQNGVTPQRVVRFAVDSGLTHVTSAAVLEANNPVFAEPTLGVVVGDEFY
ncbi:MAG: hypothetical protein ACREMO_12335, partial [Gemmatimonadales bacterium]